MKKLILIFTVLFSLGSGLFAFDFFDDRFFEIKTGSALGLSNNATTLDEWLKKELVIDLRKIADSIPDSGFTITGILDPYFHTKLDIGFLTFAVQGGVETHTSLTIGKDIFKFLGYGNELGVPIVTSIGADVDAFAFVDVNLGLNFKHFSINVMPSMFLPLVATSGSAGSATVLNDANGRIVLQYDLNFNLYSIYDFMNGTVDFQKFLKNAGYDITGELTIPFEKKLLASAKVRVPVISGKLNNLFNVSSTFVFEGSLTTQEFTQNDTGMQFGSTETSDYTVNRPLKINLLLDYRPLGNFIDLQLGAGLGVYRPFSDCYKFYPEYYLAMSLNLIRVFTFTLSTEYTDQMFMHQFGFDVNVRFLEVSTGISVQSSDFLKSFIGSGFGGYVYMTFGF